MKRGAWWPIAVTVILGTTIGANIWLVRVANGDPSFAVHENYYDRGVHWDDEMRQQARNASLGWRLTATLATIEPGQGAHLSVALRDSAVVPLDGAEFTVTARHLARSAEPVEVTMRPGVRGDYEGVVPLQRAGLWELRFEVRRDGERFTALERIDARSGPR
jgi:nitrogen fixation protein FixH